MRWRWIANPADAVPAAATGARNMAIDSALLASIAEGAPPAIRLYRWDPACLSFGRNQVARGEYDADRAAHLGLDIVRRPTGGLAVLHDAEITYSVIAPVGMLDGPRRAYRRIHEAVATGLAHLGVVTDLATPPGGGVAAPDASAPACFASPAGGEVLAAGRKLVGSAQRTERRTFLQHGSILLEGSQARVDSLRLRPARSTDDGSVAIADLLGGVPPLAEIAIALRAGFADVLGADLVAGPLSDSEQALAGSLEAKYRDDGWTWRR